MTPATTVPTKLCRKCGTLYEYPEHHFSRSRAERDGWCTKCKTCQAAYREALHAKDVNESRRRSRAYNAAFRATHQTAQKEASGRYYAAHPERCAARGADYNRRRPEVAKAKDARRRARKRGEHGRFTRADVRLLYVAQGGLCFWCDVAVGGTYHVDHLIPLAKGGSNWRDNLVISCPGCNQSKSASLPIDWAPRRWREVQRALVA